MKKIDRQGLRTWIEIDTKAIRANYRAFRKFIPKNVKMMGVVKSNAYGHNITEFALELEKVGIDFLAVDSLVEGLSLRKAGVATPILVLGYTLPEIFTKAVGKNIHLTISSMEGLLTFLKNSHASKIPIHLKVDTGMHRQGFMSHERPLVLKTILEAGEKINIAGLYTHFAMAKDPKDHMFTDIQGTDFMAWRDDIERAGLKPLIHAGATGGMLAFPELHFDAVRVGIGIYGAWPSIEIEKVLNKKISIKPVLAWKTIVSEIKEIQKGEGVGYDLTHHVSRVSRIAVCPLGYWHGYSRALSNNAEVLLHGVRAKVLGRISMDMIVIDVTDIKIANVGDEVALIGVSKGEEITATSLATRAGTTAYEILTRLNPLIKRIYK